MCPIMGSTTCLRLSNFFSLLGSLRVWLTNSRVLAAGS